MKYCDGISEQEFTIIGEYADALSQWRIHPSLPRKFGRTRHTQSLIHFRNFTSVNYY